MFVARAGIRTRSFRQRQNHLLPTTAAPKRKPQGVVTTQNYGYSLYFWIPCMLGPCIGIFLGLTTLLGGSAMCATGYYSKYFSSDLQSNGTHTVSIVDAGKQYYINNLSFIGPVLMGCGCFIMIIGCVVICEQRDKDIKLKIEQINTSRMKKRDGRRKKSIFYNSIVDKVKKHKMNTNEELEGLDNGQELLQKSKSSHFFTPCIFHNESETAEEHYLRISAALKSIPMDIIHADAYSRSYRFSSSLTPVDTRLHPKSYSEMNILNVKIEGYYLKMKEQSFPILKYPSEACLHDLLKNGSNTGLSNDSPNMDIWKKTDPKNLLSFSMPNHISEAQNYTALKLQKSLLDSSPKTKSAIQNQHNINVKSDSGEGQKGHIGEIKI